VRAAVCTLVRHFDISRFALTPIDSRPVRLLYVGTSTSRHRSTYHGEHVSTMRRIYAILGAVFLCCLSNRTLLNSTASFTM
jgi:hypothetical protein